MKLIYTEGCTNYSITADGKDLNDYTVSDSKSILKNLIDKLNLEPCDIWEITSTLLTKYGDYKFCYHCDECGDDVYEYKLKI